MNPKNRITELKEALKIIIEEKSFEQLDIFLTKHKDELDRFNILNEPADNKNGVPVHFACKENENNLDKVKILEYNGADITKADRGGRSLIHIA